MTYIKIGETLYPASINGRFIDDDWDRRASKSITLEMDYATAIELFTDGLAWSIVMPRTVSVPRLDENGEPVVNEDGEIIYDSVEEFDEFDNADYCVAGPITDNRDGTMTAKMGKFTELEEAYEILLGGYSL